jgi:cell filamentation protein
VRNEYHYIDPDHAYTDSKTGVLRNLENIDDAQLLHVLESIKVSSRLEELQIKPIKIKDSLALLNIHKYLFQDMYEWAGKLRTVEISKGGKPFFPLSHFRNAFMFIDSLIAEYRKIDKRDKVLLTRKLAEILDNTNYLHPFREGNGRAQREFLRLLALEKGLLLNLNPPDNVDVYERYMSGTINGDVELLAGLMLEIVN